MPQEGARELRRWLPEKRLRESISAENFISVLAALVATVIFICLGFLVENPRSAEGTCPEATVVECTANNSEDNFDNPKDKDDANDNEDAASGSEGAASGSEGAASGSEGAASGSEGAVEVIARIGITLSGIALGFCLSNCWAEWKGGDSRRARAIEIDNHTEREIRKTVEDRRETSMSLDTLTRNKNPESSEKSRYSSLREYFLGKRKLDIQRFLDEKALDIRELGYDHEAFLAEKKESLEKILELTDDLVSSISKLSGSESTKENPKTKPPPEGDTGPETP